MKKLYNYLFNKPKIKIGQELAYFRHTAKRLKFNWETGIWRIQIRSEPENHMWISANTEAYYKKQQEDKKIVVMDFPKNIN